MERGRGGAQEEWSLDHGSVADWWPTIVGFQSQGRLEWVKDGQHARREAERDHSRSQGRQAGRQAGAGARELASPKKKGKKKGDRWENGARRGVEALWWALAGRGRSNRGWGAAG